MIIYIRHGDDKVIDKDYPHDAFLTEKGAKLAKKTAKQLLKQYGVPSVIYYSPMTRARETCQVFLKVIQKYQEKKQKKSIKIRTIISPSLSRYFTPSEQDNPKITAETAKYNPPIRETIPDLINRMVNFHKDKLNKHSGELAWSISHGLALKKLIDQIGYYAPESVDFLETFVCISREESTVFK